MHIKLFLQEHTTQIPRARWAGWTLRSSKAGRLCIMTSIASNNWMYEFMIFETDGIPEFVPKSYLTCVGAPSTVTLSPPHRMPSAYPGLRQAMPESQTADARTYLNNEIPDSFANPSMPGARVQRSGFASMPAEQVLWLSLAEKFRPGNWGQEMSCSASIGEVRVLYESLCF